MAADRLAWPRGRGKTRSLPLYDFWIDRHEGSKLNIDQGAQIRVAHPQWDTAHGPSEFSGMPWNMANALRRANCELIPVSIGPPPRSRGEGFFSGSNHSPMVRKLKKLGARIRNQRDSLFSDQSFTRAAKHAQLAAERGDRALSEIEFDVIFGSGMSSLFAYLHHEAPIIYATDATAHLAIEAYSKVAALGKGRRDAMLMMETRAVANANVIVVPSEYCSRSMIADHAAPEERVHVVPLGANVVPVSGEQVVVPAPAPTAGNLDLLLTAADPERKQLPLAAAVVRELRRRGWHARLHYIGPKHPCCDGEEVVWAGELRLGDLQDSETHRTLLKSCHLAFLPSIGEMYGIAPIESAAYGRPAIVSDAGGLPTVVLDGQTGRVVPLQTPVPGWADAVEAAVSRPERYQSLSEAARRRYLEVLNWDVWGCSVRALAAQEIESPKARKVAGRP